MTWRTFKAVALEDQIRLKTSGAYAMPTICESTRKGNPMKLKPEQRESIRLMFGGKCAYCGIDLPEKGWHMDHVEPVVRCYSYGEMVTTEHGFTHWKSYGNGKKKVKRLDSPESHRVDNLWPSCRACNINKSSMPLEYWRKFLSEGPESLASYNGRFRHMLRFGIVTVNPEPFLFWFERFRDAQ